MPARSAPFEAGAAALPGAHLSAAGAEGVDDDEIQQRKKQKQFEDADR